MNIILGFDDMILKNLKSVSTTPQDVSNKAICLQCVKNKLYEYVIDIANEAITRINT